MILQDHSSGWGSDTQPHARNGQWAPQQIEPQGHFLAENTARPEIAYAHFRYTLVDGGQHFVSQHALEASTPSASTTRA